MPSHTPAPRKLPDGFELVPTPDPKRFSFRVRMDVTSFNPTVMLPAGTAYKECSFLSSRPRMGVQGFEDYVYTYVEKADPFLWFYFGYKNTAEERLRPFRTFATNQNYPWPAVLEDLYFVQSSFSQSVWDGLTMQSTPTILPRYRFRPSVSIDSLCVIQQYLDAVPWTQEEMEHEQPIPTDINGSYIGVSFDFPRCLHNTVIVKEMLPNARILYGQGMTPAPSGRNVTQMVFPRTNFTDWTSFVFDDKQQPTGGLFLREVATLFPPAPPESILR